MGVLRLVGRAVLGGGLLLQHGSASLALLSIIKEVLSTYTNETLLKGAETQ